MSKIFLVSDWHLCHDQKFVWQERGFQSVDEMNEAIVERHNSLVSNEDDVYVLGDLMLNDNEKGMELFNQMNGNFHIIRGNHDTDSRIKLYEENPRVVEIVWSTEIRLGKNKFILSHWPTLVANGEEKHGPRNLHGHTHQKENLSELGKFNYHVGMDSHNCYPVLLDTIIEDLKQSL